VKRDCRDIKFSELIRLAANWTCQRCGREFQHGSTSGLHCSHFYSRRKKSVRWHPLNAAAHCHGCHAFLGENPIVFDRWIFDYLGKEKYNRLKILQRQTVRLTKPYLEDLNKHLGKELKVMEERRASGDLEHYFFTPFE